MVKISKDQFKEAYRRKYKYLFDEPIEEGNNQQKYEALGSLVKSYILESTIETNKTYNETKEKQVYYFSMEFLLGRLLGDALMNMGLLETCNEALKEIGRASCRERV